MSDTPKTDAFVAVSLSVPFFAVDFCRSLERENNNLKSELEELRKEKAEWKARWRQM